MILKTLFCVITSTWVFVLANNDEDSFSDPSSIDVKKILDSMDLSGESEETHQVSDSSPMDVDKMLDSIDLSEESEETQQAIVHYKLQQMEKKLTIKSAKEQFREMMQQDEQDQLENLNGILNHLKKFGLMGIKPKGPTARRHDPKFLVLM